MREVQVVQGPRGGGGGALGADAAQVGIRLIKIHGQILARRASWASRRVAADAELWRPLPPAPKEP
ncbi:hypothetical protein GCM10010449_35430 [Streptomyces rectiviolaceus]|uniref:Transposase n=1 Tax=Streptomyces rectiviolaceus TaxID=332591 RepID=A0ABP6MJP0_9ACTN